MMLRTVAEKLESKADADRLVLLMALLYFVVIGTWSLARYSVFAYGLDLAIYDHYVWNFSVGDLARNSIIEGSQDWNYYFVPLLMVAVPLYALWGNAVTLLIFQTLALASSVFPIYWYARSQLGRGLVVVIAASYLLYPALQHVNLAQFHVISLTIPLISYATFFLLRNRYAPSLVCAFLLLMVKEEALFAVLGLGLYIMLVRRKYALGALVCLITAMWFIILINYLFPMLTGRSYFMARSHLFGQLGMSIPDILTTVATRPERLLQLFISPYNF